MPGLTSGLYIGLSGLQSAQAALEVVGHNIANVNTDSYTRQQATLSANTPQTSGTLTFGTGVNLADIAGVRDKYLDLQIVKTTSRESGASTRYSGLEAVSTLLEEDGTTGLSTLLQDCFEAFQDLSASPESASARTGVVGQAQSLVSGLQERYQALEDQISAADQNAGNIVQEINTLAQQIAELNRSIPAEGASSDEQDQRQALVNELAGLVDVQVYEDSAGDLQVSLASGSAVLVGGTTAHTLAMAEDGKVTVSTSGGTAIDVTAGITQGSLGANLDLRDNLLLGYQKQLDQLAAGIIDGVNALHREGYALDGTTTDLDFFTGTSVRDMAVDPDLVEDPSLVAAAGTANASGDNTVAKAIAALQEATDTVDTDGDGVGDTGPFSSVLSSLVSEIGLAVQGQETAAATQENLLAALQTQRDSVSGVDLDEEAVKLITCQRAYQASANFISVLDDLMEQLLTQLGS